MAYISSLQAILLLVWNLGGIESFLLVPKAPPEAAARWHGSALGSSLLASATDNGNQWDLFLRHHAPGSWKGIWTTYDIKGDVVDETVASLDYDWNEEQTAIQQSHHITIGASRADCSTWMRTKTSSEIKSFPVGVVAENRLNKMRLVNCAMVNGPVVLRSGTIMTELVLCQGDGRVRVTLQYSSDQRLCRVIVSREALRVSPPTLETEAADPPPLSNPLFYRTVTPALWQQPWCLEKTTMLDSDVGDVVIANNLQYETKSTTDEEVIPSSWHPLSNENVWSMRLPGGIWISCPRTLLSGGDCRVSWMPRDDQLLSVHAGVARTASGVSLASIKCHVGVLAGDSPVAESSLEPEVLLPLPDMILKGKVEPNEGVKIADTVQEAERTTEKENSEPDPRDLLSF